MSASVDARIERLLERRKTRPPADPPTRDQERRRARMRVLDELPRLLSRLSNCVAELNDRLGEGGVWITVKVAERSPTFEEMVTLGLEDDPPNGTHLVLTVDFHGQLVFLIANDGRRSLLRTSSVFEADRDLIREVLVDYLEARFSEGEV